MEKTVKLGGKRAGHAIREFDSEGLVLLVLRGDKEIIPRGDTVLEAGDVLVILGSR
ncbi:MAG: TrkA C-terminal domain-containing protein [Bacteroidales bacterium]|nr:TrkA C-terminal domain-containing protein [Bacteroidales bacterium]